jgi:hypothetical protein
MPASSARQQAAAPKRLASSQSRQGAQKELSATMMSLELAKKKLKLGKIF